MVNDLESVNRGQDCLPAFAGVAELVDAMDLKSISTYMEYRFDSGPRQFKHLFVY